MNNRVLNLINNNKWETAMNALDNPFTPIYNEKTLFHYACLRGNKSIINKYLEINSEKIYLSDNDGNTGCHLLAYSEWDQILLPILRTHPTFLKLKNANDDFIYDLVKDRHQTLKIVLNLMKNNNMESYFNFIKHTNRTLLLDLIDFAANDDKYFSILKLVLKTNPDMSIPTSSPPLIYSIVKSYDNVTFFLLNKMKTNVNVKTDHQTTPLQIAILQKHSKLIDAIIGLNPDVNYAGFENKNVPLSMCWKNGLIESADKILQSDDIDYNKKDGLLNTPIYYLIYLIAKNRRIMTKEQAKLCNKQLQTLIINSDLEHLNINNETPLHLLIKYKLWQEFKEDISKKTLNLNTISTINETPISLLSEEELKDFVTLQSTTTAYEMKDKNIILPTVDTDGEFGLFNADGIHNIIYIFVMLSKYKNLIVPTQSKISEKQKWDRYKILSHCVITSDTVGLVHSLMSLYYTTFYTVIPAIIIWKDKNLHFYESDNMYLQRCLSIPVEKVRFVMLRITLVLDDTSLHANIVIFDKKLSKLIRFEPYGDWEFNDSYNLDQMLVKMFMDALKEINTKVTIKYIRPRDYLDKTKFQTTSLGDHFAEKNLGDPAGYCLAWCFWFLELKLNNPDDDENLLVGFALDKILKSDKQSNNPLLTHIRSYAKKLDKDKNLLLEKMGIPKTDVYKMSYDGSKLETIKQFVDGYDFLQNS